MPRRLHSQPHIIIPCEINARRYIPGIPRINRIDGRTTYRTRRGVATRNITRLWLRIAIPNRLFRLERAASPFCFDRLAGSGIVIRSGITGCCNWNGLDESTLDGAV